MHSIIKKVKLSEIDFENTELRISRNHISENLVKSVGVNGILEPPVLLERNDHLIVVSGFNRIRAAEKNSIREIDARVEKEVTGEEFVRLSLLKSYRNEIGPAGKMRFMRIMREFFLADGKEITQTGIKGMNLPAEFCSKETVDAVLSLPPVLLDYLDIRDCNFRIIKNILKLKPLALDKLTEWVDSTWMRLNYFRSITEYLYDIQKKDNLESVLDIDPDEKSDRKQNEEMIFANVYNARYPEYSMMKQRADSLTEYFSTKGIRIELPPFFEGKTAGLSVSVAKGNSLSDVMEILAEADEEKLSELLGLL